MNGLLKLTALALLMTGGAAACDNRQAERRSGAGTETGVGTGSETMTADTAVTGGTGTAGETGTMGDTTLSEADKKAGRTVEVPGDSIRLEDTLSQPPPSSDTTKK